MRLNVDDVGLAATTRLAGGTGVAGFAKRTDGSTMQFVARYGAIGQTWRSAQQRSSLIRQLHSFQQDATSDAVLDGPLQLVVAYRPVASENTLYGRQLASLDTWTPLDDIETAAAQLGDNVQLIFMQYVNEHGYSLAAGRTATGEGIFWSGVRVDFDKYIGNKN